MITMNILGGGPIIDDAFERKMADLKREGRINSYYRYRSALHALQQFAGSPIRARDINVAWLQNCRQAMVQSGLSTTTIHIYMKALKSVWHDLAREGRLPRVRDPFAAFNMPAPSRRRMAMSKEEISAIAGYSGSRATERWRDLWLFSYMCNGINFRDMIFLKYSDIRDGEIVFERSKTKMSSKVGTRIHAPINARMREIIERWGNPPVSGDTYIFDFASGDEDDFQKTMLVRRIITLCNRGLARVAGQLGIPRFTTYSARHSFATILSRGGVDISYISDCLGHSNLQTTKTYLAGFGKEERERYSKILTDFCNDGE